MAGLGLVLGVEPGFRVQVSDSCRSAIVAPNLITASERMA